MTPADAGAVGFAVAMSGAGTPLLAVDVEFLSTITRNYSGDMGIPNFIDKVLD